MKVFINNRDLLTWPRAMADTLRDQGHEPIIVDNESTYPPLLVWYSVCPYHVVRLPNYGSRAPWELSLLTDSTEPFVVTDPDLDISTIPHDWPEVLAEGLKLHPGHHKCGLSLEDRDVPSENPASWLDGFTFGEGNPKYWTEGRQGTRCMFHPYPIDTTFALYRPHASGDVGGCRAGRPYTARHLPFHLVLKHNPSDPAYQIEIDDEVQYYYEHARSNAFGPVYSTTKSRLTPLLVQRRTLA